MKAGPQTGSEFELLAVGGNAAEPIEAVQRVEQ